MVAGRAVLLVAVAGASALASYAMIRGWKGVSAGESSTSAGADAGPESEAPRFATGRHLAAYVLVASECGFCNQIRVKKAIAAIRDSLRARHADAFAGISVIGVAIDGDIDSGLDYLRGLQASQSVFDELSIGGSWLNQQVIRLVWREGVATPAVPQVVLIERRVDATAYPRHIEVHRDSVLL